MSWNIEVLCVKETPAWGAVPDVFEATDETVGFEDATSSERGADLCVATIGDWHVTIDVQCRLSSRSDSFGKPPELYLVRIADEPFECQYVKGKQTLETDGLEDCLAVAPRADRDGELCAVELLVKRTGISWAALQGATFTVYTVG